MKILVVGLRGLPNVEGGVESHAEKLYPLLAQLGHDVEIIVRTPFHPRNKPLHWQGVRIRRCWSPRQNGLEAFVHTFLAVLWAAWLRPDVLHIHAIGPGLFTPLARLFGLKVVVTHHGPDYDREKWGAAARWILRTGERLAMRFANERIVISKTIQNLVKSQYGVESVLIPNGVQVHPQQAPTELLENLGLQAGRYILQVSRLVPEKRQLDLIAAFKHAGLSSWSLVLVGTLKPEEPYTAEIQSACNGRDDIVLTGFRTGAELAEILSNAGCFVLPSAHEGLPIAMLEALSYGLPVIASDIPANLEVGLEEGAYFSLGDVQQLSERLQAAASQPIDEEDRSQRVAWVQREYDWHHIAKRTQEAYCRFPGQ